MIEKNKQIGIGIIVTFIILLTGCSIQDKIPCLQPRTQIIYSNGDFILQPIFCDITKDCANTLINYINNAQTSIHILIYSLTEDSITQSLIDAKKRGVDVKIIVDDTQYNNKNMKIKIDALEKVGIPVVIMKVAGYGVMHNKIAIIDGTVIITGSFNYTKNANKNNKENIIVIIDKTGDLATKYEEYFITLWNE